MSTSSKARTSEPEDELPSNKRRSRDLVHLGAGAPAWAHANQPRDGSRLTQSPKTISVQFSEEIVLRTQATEGRRHNRRTEAYRTNKRNDAIAAMRRFSMVGHVAVAGAIACGLATAWLLNGRLPVPFATDRRHSAFAQTADRRGHGTPWPRSRWDFSQLPWSPS